MPPVPGWRAGRTNTLRLWSAKPKRISDLEPFNRGEYMEAAAPEVLADTISRVPYPDDRTEIGKELRLKQEYFFTSASLRDPLRRFLAHSGDLKALPSKVAIQMNDTHPAIAGPELIRLLVDDHGLSFDEAFDIAQGTLNYTNHTLLPEALEAWEVSLMGEALPRHMALIEGIDGRLARDACTKGAAARIVDYGAVNMDTLAFTCANKVNDVSALHTDLLKQTVFSTLHQICPERIVTIMQANKQRLTDWIRAEMGVQVSPDAMLDIQIKRIHEYKRQLMNALETAALANAIRRDPDANWTPRVKVFGGKAAPAYLDAKNIIRLINDIAVSINNDPVIGDRLKVIFPPNYNVSMAEILIPAADLSEQISTAGKEASGTGNMKFALNGAVTIGTLDGANVEIRDHVEDENIYIFGMTADEVQAARLVDNGYADKDAWARTAALNTARSGSFSSDRTIQGYAEDIWGVEALSGDDK